MKKNIVIGVAILFMFLITSTYFIVSAQGMLALSVVEGMGYFNSSSDNAAIQSQQQEELEGKKFLDGIKNKTVICSQLNDPDFEKIGEYFMGKSIGNTQRHIAMNEMMKRMMGEKGEEQAHKAMGKRLSGCNSTAAFPSQDAGFLPMMGMLGMMGGESLWGGRIYGMMSNGLGIFGVITWILIILFLILGIKYYWKGLNKKK